MWGLSASLIAAGALLAEIGALDVPGWITQGGGFALAAWYMWYTQTRTEPERLKTFAEQQSQLRQTFVDIFEKQREHDANESRLQREENDRNRAAFAGCKFQAESLPKGHR